jgi:hypothetical protein
MVKQRNSREKRQEKPERSGKRNKNITLISFKEKDIKQRWLITSEGCPTCEELKRGLKKEIKAGVIKLTDVGDEKGFEIIAELGINEVPIFIVELNDGFPIRYVIDE